MTAPSYAELLRLTGPEIILALAALGVLFLDLFGMRAVAPGYRQMVAASVTGLGCLAALFWIHQVGAAGSVAEGMLVGDSLTGLVKQALLILTLVVAVLAVDARFTEHIGEFHALLLLGTIGMLLLVSAENLLMIFVALELTSLSLYVLTAFDKRSPRAAEAGLKYFLFGSAAAAFTLFAFSLLYGLTGSIQLREIADALRLRGPDPVSALAVVMAMAGFGFKVAAVPFHLWAPEAYQGAPTSSAGFVASGSKVAGFFILAKVLMTGFAGPTLPGGWVLVVILMAGVSMVIGNLAAIAQSNVKRLLAYSAVAHAGYTFIGLAADSFPGVTAVVYYSVTYAAAVLGAFAVVGIVEHGGGEGKLQDLAGLARRSPLLAACLAVFVLSLAGIPPLPGFFGKFYLFAAGLGDAPLGGTLFWLVVLAIGMSAVSLYYYLQILKQAYVRESDAGSLRPSAACLSAVVLLALGVLLLGCAPHFLVGPLSAAIATSGF